MCRLASAQKVTLGVVDPPVGNAGVCTGPALLNRKDVDGFTTQFDCQGIATPAEVRVGLAGVCGWGRRGGGGDAK
jgi:hypothetical protein